MFQGKPVMGTFAHEDAAGNPLAPLHIKTKELSEWLEVARKHPGDKELARRIADDQTFGPILEELRDIAVDHEAERFYRAMKRAYGAPHPFFDWVDRKRLAGNQSMCWRYPDDGEALSQAWEEARERTKKKRRLTVAIRCKCA